MNAVPTDEELLQAPVEGPGKELKSTRQAQGLDLPRVASMLHLSQPMLEALEADDYEALPGSVFIQGYLRKYAKLLNVPVEPVMEAFDAIRPDKDDKPSLHIHQVRKELRSSHTAVRLVTRLIVIGVIALPLIWWYGYLKLPDSFSSLGEMFSGRVTNDQNETEASLIPLQEGEQSLPLLIGTAGEETGSVASTGYTAPMEAQATEAEAAQEEVIAVAQEEVSQPLDQAVETAGDAMSSKPVLNQEVATLETAEQVISEAAVPAIADDRVELVFSGESWVEISDSSGEFKIKGVMPKASRKILEGEPPYRMVLGNAQQIEINVGGKRHDFSGHISGNVARFTLNP